VLPVLAGLGVFILKFGVPFPNLILNQQVGGPSAVPGWITFRRLNHGQLQGLRFVPTALLAYLRPDTLVFTHSFPFLNYRFPTFASVKYLGLKPGSMYVIDVSSITDAMPLAVVLGLFGVVQGLRSTWKPRVRAVGSSLEIPVLCCAVAMGAAWCVTLTTIGITQRYLSDLYPLVSLGASYGTAHLTAGLAKIRTCWSVVAVATMSLAVLASVGINLALAYQEWWHLVT